MAGPTPLLLAVPEIQQAIQIARTAASGYLRNVDRRPETTCQVCCAPEAYATLCHRCRKDADAHGDGLADLVVPVVYGGHNRQSEVTLYDYKKPIAAQPGDQRRALVSYLFTLTSILHNGCIAGTTPIHAVVVVPSTKQRDDHPLAGLTTGVMGWCPRIPVSANSVQPGTRVTTTGRFSLHPEKSLAGAHVLVIDDTWTTGAKSQSMALDLRVHGVARVTTLVLARWLDPSWEATASYLSQHTVEDYNPLVCPVSGGQCPP